MVWLIHRQKWFHCHRVSFLLENDRYGSKSSCSPVKKTRSGFYKLIFEILVLVTIMLSLHSIIGINAFAEDKGNQNFFECFTQHRTDG